MTRPEPRACHRGALGERERSEGSDRYFPFVRASWNDRFGWRLVTKRHARRAVTVLQPAIALGIRLKDGYGSERVFADEGSCSAAARRGERQQSARLLTLNGTGLSVRKGREAAEIPRKPTVRRRSNSLLTAWKSNRKLTVETANSPIPESLVHLHDLTCAPTYHHADAERATLKRSRDPKCPRC